MATADEIRGDWSNLKGTHYHLLYALWLILRNEAASVYFYQGNDLLARFALPSPIPPPDPTSLLETDEEPPIALRAERATSDTWIQLKSTKSNWSCSRLLEKNLLVNFICNGFQSEAQNRDWRVSLITQGMVNQGDVKDFVKAPNKHPILNTQLKEVLRITRVRLRKEGWPVAETKLSNLYRIALEVLSQLSGSEPVALETLKADINAELTRAYPDQQVVRELEDTLIGALIRDASVGPMPARVYDSAWINTAAGKPVVNRGTFDQDPVSACDSAIREVILEMGFSSKKFALRDRLRNVLDQFMLSNKTLFVLIGLSGSGKSWACADWASHGLSGELRLLIPGQDLDHQKDLAALVQNRLRPWTSAFWPAEQFLKRLADASKLEGRKPFTAIVENLIPVGDLNTYRRDLSRIVGDCRNRGFKLVLTCQKQLWELHQLGAEISSNDIFVLDSESQSLTENNKKFRDKPIGHVHSFLLSDFSPEEQTSALSKRLSPTNAHRLANHFRLPGFTLLRSPYLMSRYLESNNKQLEELVEPPPFNVHELLDSHINSLLVRAASELSCPTGDIEPAFNVLIERLWPDRQEGLPLNKAVACLATEFPEKSFDLLTSLRRVGLITSGNPIRLADAHIADHLFARLIQARQQETTNGALRELNPEIDSGVVAALIRDAALDPIYLAERFLKMNSRWASGVALGLAQGSPDDWRALALLTVLLGSKEEHVLEAGYSGLGQLAARGESAWKWVAELYLGDHANTWYRGSRALANVIEYFPGCVEAAIRTRLTRLLHIDETFTTNRDRRKSWLLSGALDPLRGVTHQSSATVAQRVVNRYRIFTGDNHDWVFTNDLDHARGRIALFAPDLSLNTLLAELGSEDGETRYRAAYALRIVVAERPDLVKEALLTSLVKESNFQILLRLLMIAFHLIRGYPDELLIAIKKSKAGDLYKPLTTTGITLSLLGNIASKNTTIVESQLPRNLEGHPSWARAFSTEMLAYAWWRCAETSVSAMPVLQEVSNPNTADVEKEYVPFALRGSSIALLGLMAIEQGLHSDELIGRQAFYPEQQKQFLYLEAVEFFQSNVKELIKHDSFNRFVDLLTQSVIEEEGLAQAYFHPAHQALYRCASMSLELLAQTAAVLDDPLPLLNRLPRNWQAIRAATRLLEMGRHDASIVNFARESFAGLESGGTAQALEERRQCLAQLAFLNGDSSNSLNEQRESTVKWGFLQSEGNSLGLAVLAAEQPENLLSFIENDIKDEYDLPTLYYLLEQARSWPTLLVARLYSRMFSNRPIRYHEASALCEQMLAAVRSLPHSSIQEEYEWVYLSINNLLRGEVVTGESNQRRISDRENLISKSHQLCFEIVTGFKTISEQNAQAWLKSFLYDDRAWLESGFCELRHNLLLQGTSYMMYFWPAARLSLVAAAGQLGIKDPVGTLMTERSESTKVINAHSYLLRGAQIDEEDMRHAKYALAELQKREILTPDDERLPDTIGLLLLEMNRLNEAETALKRSLSLPLSRGGVRAHTLRNLACVYARMNNESDCRTTLEDAARIEPLDQKWLTEDTDLETMRSTDWFKGLTGHASG